MAKTYTGAWGVFDEDYEEGLDKAFRRYQEAGISCLMYAGIAHTFDVNPQYYKSTKIDPCIQNLTLRKTRVTYLVQNII